MVSRLLGVAPPGALLPCQEFDLYSPYLQPIESSRQLPYGYQTTDYGSDAGYR